MALYRIYLIKILILMFLAFKIVQTEQTQVGSEFREEKQLANKIPNETVVKFNPTKLFLFDNEGKKCFVKIPISNKNLQTVNSTRVLEFGKTYQIYSELVSFVVNANLASDEFYFIEMTGIGKIKVQIYDENEKQIDSHTFQLNSKQTISYMVFDQTRFLMKKGHTLKMQNIESKDKVDFWVCQIQKSISLDINFNTSVQLFSRFSKQTHFKITFDPNTTIFDEDNRVQFTVETSLEDQKLRGKEKIYMIINSRKKVFPSIMDFELKASANYGSGLVKTISKSNKYFCNEANCVYFLSVNTRDVDSFYFYPTLMRSVNSLEFSTNMILLEELEKKESIFYEIVPPPKTKSFSIKYAQIENESECFINIGQQIWAEDQKLDYVLSKKKNTEIYISTAEFEKLRVQSNRIYLKCVNSDAFLSSTFYFKFEGFQDNQIPMIESDSLKSGNSLDRELINFLFDANTNKTEVVNMGFSLSVFGGSGLIIAKECTDSDQNCKVTQKDLSKIQSSSPELENQNAILKFTTTEYLKDDSKINNLILNFKCGNETTKPQQDEEFFQYSRTCKFAIALWFSQELFLNKMSYELTVSAANVHQNLQNKKSTVLKTQKAGTFYYKLAINSTQILNDIKINIQFFVLTGRATAYLANNNPYPFEQSYQKKVPIRHEASSFLKTKSYNITLILRKEELINDNNLYITIETEGYTILDILPTIRSAQQNEHSFEMIALEQNYARTIQAEDFFLNSKNQTVYFKNFHFKFPKNLTSNITIDRLEINLNSNIYGLRICVYQKFQKLDLQTTCDFESNIEHLTLLSENLMLNQQTNLLISIQKIIDKDHIIVRFPVDFSIFTSINNSESLYELHLPGSSLRSYIEKRKNVKIRFNMSQIKQNGVIFFSSNDRNLKVDLYKENSQHSIPITSLRNYQFGVIIKNVDVFKSSFCSDDCVLNAFLYTNSSASSQFTFTYTINDKPIVLKEGLSLQIPNNMNLYFLYESKAETNVNFDVYCYQEKSVAYSKIIDKELLSENVDLSTEINEIKFDLKSDISNKLQLVYSKKDLKEREAEVILYLLEPKFHFNQPDSKSSMMILDEADLAKVYIQTEILKLEGFDAISSTVSIGEIKYYSILLKEGIDFSITSMSVEGAVTVLLEKGENEYPTVERFWKKSQNNSGDVILVNFWEYKSAYSEYNFIVGVYGDQDSSFSIMFLPNFKNLIKVEFQKYVDLRIDPGKYYYLDFSTKKIEFESMIYADENDVEASILQYDAKKGEDLIGEISRESSFIQKKTLKNGALPIFGLNQVTSTGHTHVIVRLLTLDAQAHVNFLLFDPQQPIRAPAEKRFVFVQKADTQSIFSVKLHNKYQKVDIDMKLFFGSISFSVSDRVDGFSTFRTLTATDQGQIPFEVKDEQNNIIIFKEIFIKVVVSKYSKFSVFVKPKDRFKQMIVGESEIAYCDPDNDSYLFYNLQSDQLNTVNKMHFEINTLAFNDQKPEMLFANKQTKVLDKNISFLPAQILDFEEKNLEDLRQLIYQVKPEVGFYVVKIGKNPNRYPVKVTLALNNVQRIEENGLYKGTVATENKDSDSFTLYISEAGEYRLVWESCFPISVINMLFKGDKENTTASMHSDLAQTYPIILIDESNSIAKKSLEQITYPIIRGKTEGSGKFEFKISINDTASILPENKLLKRYTLMSEFKPNNKELILKDYVDIFKNEKTFESFLVKYDFIYSESRLKVSIPHPNLKLQLLSDYPNLQKIQIKFKVYLLSENNFFEQIQSCGISALESCQQSYQSVVSEFKKEEFSQIKETKLIDVVFEKKDLENFGRKEKLNLACYLSVRFFENEEEEWKVAIDLKYTNVPYFFLTIRNKYLSEHRTKFMLFVTVLVIFTFMSLGCFIINSRNKNTQSFEKIPAQEKENEENQENNVSISSIMSEIEKLEGRDQ